RSIPVAQFLLGPFQNALRAGEIAVEAVVPPAAGTATGSYLKLERRVGDFATAGVAVALERSDGTVTRAGIALTGVGPATIHATAAEDALVGKPLPRRPSSSRPPERRRPPSRAATTAGARTTSGTSWPRSCAALWHETWRRRHDLFRGPRDHPRRRRRVPDHGDGQRRAARRRGGA